MKVSNEQNEVIRVEDIQKELEAFKVAHKDEPNPKRFHVYLLECDFFTPLQFKREMQALGLAYNQRYKCW